MNMDNFGRTTPLRGRHDQAASDPAFVERLARNPAIGDELVELSGRLNGLSMPRIGVSKEPR